MEEALREYRLIRRLSKRPYELKPQTRVLKKSWERVGMTLNLAVNNVISPVDRKGTDAKTKK